MLKRYSSLLLACLTLPLIAVAFTKWNLYSIDTQLSLQLPSPAQEIDLTKHGISYAGMRMFITSNEVGIYQITRIECPPDQISTIRTPADLQVFYNSMQQTMLSDIKGQLLAKTDFHTPVGDGIEIKFRAPFAGTANKTISYTRALLVKNICYSFSFLPRTIADTTSSRAAEQRQRFFNSITVAP